jgi:hypothetical protein
MFMVFHLLKTCIRNPSLFFIFSPSHLALRMGETSMLTACIIFQREEVNFDKFLFFAKLVCQTIEGQIFLFYQN